MISAQNPETIRSMFDRIAGRYDLANTVLSLGTHRIWKRRLVRLAASELSGPASILDCATGTGDIAELWSRDLARKGMARDSRIVATDFSEGMLEQARRRLESERGRFPTFVRFEWADVQQLSYADSTFDRATISFGIRNEIGRAHV